MCNTNTIMIIIIQKLATYIMFSLMHLGHKLYEVNKGDFFSYKCCFVTKH